MGSTGKQKVNTTPAPVQVQTQKITLSDKDTASLLNRYKWAGIISDGWAHPNVQTANIINKVQPYAAQLVSAAQRLTQYGGIPRLSSNFAAGVLWQSLPVGTVIDITGTNLPSKYDGRWILGNGKNALIWRHLTKADGSKADESVWSENSPGQWMYLHDQDKGTTMRVVRLGKFK